MNALIDINKVDQIGTEQIERESRLTQSFRKVWDSIPLPTVIGNSNQDQISGTNARVFKDSDGSSDSNQRPRDEA